MILSDSSSDLYTYRTGQDQKGSKIIIKFIEIFFVPLAEGIHYLKKNCINYE